MGGIVSGIGDAIGSIFGGGQSQPTQPNINIYQPSGTPQIDSQLQGLLSTDQSLLSNLQSYNPYIQSAFQNLYNSPQAAGYQAGANTAGNAFNLLGNQGTASGTLTSDAAIGLLPGAMNVMNMGLDPQSALYNQMLQKATDTGNITNSMYGLTGQQAAGNEAQDINSFNQNWQNNQLSRAIAGLQGAGQGVVQAGQGATAGQNIGSAAANSYLAGGATPYNAAQNIGIGQQNALSTALGQSTAGINAANPTINALLSYLGQGVGASTAGANSALGDYYAQLQSQSDLGAGLGGLAGLFTPGAGGTSAGGNIFSGIGNLFGSGGTQAGNALPWLGPTSASSSGGIMDFLSSIAPDLSFLGL